MELSNDKYFNPLSDGQPSPSCRYDTYRLRSRRSQVDETLFGEPLSRQLLNRSKSMEVSLERKEVT